MRAGLHAAILLAACGSAASFCVPGARVRPTRARLHGSSRPMMKGGWFDGALAFTKAPKQSPEPRAMGTGRAPTPLPGFRKGKKYLKKGDTYTELGGSRYEDGEDRRLSQGGTGGGMGIRKGTGNSYRNTESARFGSADPGQQIRKEKLEAYINSEYEASDGTFGKIISGSLLVTIFGLFIGVYMYYGGDGLLTAARIG